MSFNRISAGTFTMGSPEGETGRESDENQHRVTLRAYYMQATEVTQGQWKAVMGAGNNPSRFTTCGDECPIEQVSWGDTQIFLSRLNSLGMGTYRLPTEAEWEYAARAGNTTAFTNGNDPRDLDVMGWWWGNSDIDYAGCQPSEDGERCSGTHPVAQKYPNAYGLYDMHGNVYEWCRDWYEENYSYSSEPITNPQGPATGSYRVLRGGAWFNSARFCRSANRGRNPSDCVNGSIGFRLVCTQPGG